MLLMYSVGCILAVVRFLRNIRHAVAVLRRGLPERPRESD